MARGCPIQAVLVEQPGFEPAPRFQSLVSALVLAQELAPDLAPEQAQEPALYSRSQV